mmetsp:Transcript_34395/g.95109  ORF Transcript_34395/g.95109 Transcript_34395/m.95109 type:complete len:212 (+) Transcript_34395:1104-1739(+)
MCCSGRASRSRAPRCPKPRAAPCDAELPALAGPRAPPCLRGRGPARAVPRKAESPTRATCTPAHRLPPLRLAPLLAAGVGCWRGRTSRKRSACCLKFRRSDVTSTPAARANRPYRHLPPLCLAHLLAVCTDTRSGRVSRSRRGRRRPRLQRAPLRWPGGQRALRSPAVVVAPPAAARTSWCSSNGRLSSATGDPWDEVVLLPGRLFILCDR